MLTINSEHLEMGSPTYYYLFNDYTPTWMPRVGIVLNTENQWWMKDSHNLPSVT